MNLQIRPVPTSDCNQFHVCGSSAECIDPLQLDTSVRGGAHLYKSSFDLDQLVQDVSQGQVPAAHENVVHRRVASWTYHRDIVALSELRALGRIFHLKNPIPVTISYEDDDVWWCELKELGIIAFGGSQAEALTSFCEDFAVLWEAIAQSADETLAKDAILVKHAFRRLVKVVEVE